MSSRDTQNIYLVGGGIASLAAAVYLIQDAGISGENITIFEAATKLGGSLDAQEVKKKGGYTMRGIRMFEEKSFNCTFDLMSRIPSLITPTKNLRQIFLEYNKKNRTCSKSRLIINGQAVEQHSFNLKIGDRLALIRLFLKSEKKLENKTIEDHFNRSFFRSNFWYEFCTVFAFKPDHSLIEFRRYLIRFLQDFSRIDTLEGIEVTAYNQYESLVLPIVDWLKKQSVNFSLDSQILDIEFKEGKSSRYPDVISLKKKERLKKIKLKENDHVFVTLGSMVTGSCFGSMKKAPVIDPDFQSPAWQLWKNLAKGKKEFGRPGTFTDHVAQSSWTSFTIYLKDNTFPKLMEKYIDRKVANFGGVNLIGSNWFASLVINYKPYFHDQAAGTFLVWGYGLRSNEAGNYVKKKMTECSGEEILTELVHHLGFVKDLKKILASAVCIPCYSPYVTSQFLPRAIADRPKLIPENYKHFAFLGQFSEMPNDVVFTVDYSVRSAQTAVYSLFNVKRDVTPIFQGSRHINIVLKAFKTLFR